MNRHTTIRRSPMIAAFLTGLCFVALSVLVPCDARAQASAYPNKPIKLVVPYKGSTQALSDVMGGQIEFMALPETKQKLLQMGADPRAMSGSELQGFLKSERETWGNVIRAANIKID